MRIRESPRPARLFSASCKDVLCLSAGRPRPRRRGARSFFIENFVGVFFSQKRGRGAVLFCIRVLLLVMMQETTPPIPSRAYSSSSIPVVSLGLVSASTILAYTFGSSVARKVATGFSIGNNNNDFAGEIFRTTPSLFEIRKLCF